ncbi:MAG TPA: hypothetical protein VLB03_02900 [Nocardioidaceae bacterium]|nr:hypothetical protein [Nocardioidaceae bacterium]
MGPTTGATPPVPDEPDAAVFLTTVFVASRRREVPVLAGSRRPGGTGQSFSTGA